MHVEFVSRYFDGVVIRGADVVSICLQANGKMQSERGSYNHHSKHGRKSREFRNKNQEWPEVPEIEKIDEKNPEILAMKILESGRQIEASKMKNVDVRRDVSRQQVKDRAYAPKTAPFGSSFTNGTAAASASAAATAEGALKVAFFEDRIKNIITNALNEDNKSGGGFSRSENWPKDGFVENGEHKGSIPDYTQVSPAKLALRRHLSQEKIVAPTPPTTQPSNFIGTRTIGDLVSGEIERTLEISNQSIINKVVPMCLGQNTTNPNKNEFADSLIQKSLASSFANGKHNENFSGNQYPKNSRSSVLYSTTNSQSVPYSSKYPTVHLPRAEMKPYHESYFTDMKPPTKEEPVEGYVLLQRDDFSVKSDVQ